jgi:hypothetical protein
VSLFQQPSQGDRINMNEHVGSLALFYVHEVRQGITTPYGEKEAIECDVHILDGPRAGEDFMNSLIFQGGLIGSLRSAAGGDPVLARITQGVSKPGQQPPFILGEFTPADATVAETWIKTHKPGVQQPANGNGAAPAATPAATAPAAIPAAANGVDPAVLAALPPEVQALLAQR